MGVCVMNVSPSQLEGMIRCILEDARRCGRYAISAGEVAQILHEKYRLDVDEDTVFSVLRRMSIYFDGIVYDPPSGEFLILRKVKK